MPVAPRTRFVALALGALAGVLMCLQSRMNGELSRQWHTAPGAAVWSFGSGLVLLTGAAVAFPVVRGRLRALLYAVRSGEIPVWQCLGGAAGGLFVGAQAWSVPVIGVALFSVAVVGGQTLAALLVDRVGLGAGGAIPVSGLRVAGAGLAVAGVVLSSGVLGSGAGAAGGARGPGLVVVVFAVAMLTAVQQATNSRVNRVTGHVLSTTWLNFAVGSVVLVVVLAVSLATGGSLRGVGPAPWWVWWGGLAGVGFIAVAAWAITHVGVLGYSLTVLAANLATAIALDHLDGRPLTSALASGVLLTVAASVLTALGRRTTTARPRGERDRAGRHTANDGLPGDGLPGAGISPGRPAPRR